MENTTEQTITSAELLEKLPKFGVRGKFPVTIYTSSDFMGNIVKYEGWLNELGLQDYAQYRAVPYVHFVPKGKRNKVGFVKTYDYYIYIVAGHGHPDPEELFSVKVSDMMSTAKYRSFDDRYKTDFDPIIEGLDATVLLDCRKAKGTKKLIA